AASAANENRSLMGMSLFLSRPDGRGRLEDGRTTEKEGYSRLGRERAGKQRSKGGGAASRRPVGGGTGAQTGSRRGSAGASGPSASGRKERPLETSSSTGPNDPVSPKTARRPPAASSVESSGPKRTTGSRDVPGGRT